MIISIDPGIKGALFIQDRMEIIDPPILTLERKVRKGKTAKKNILNLSELKNLFPKEGGIAVIEEVSARENDGKYQVSSLMRNFGTWEGFCAANGFKLVYVRPAKWKRDLKLIHTDKEASRQLAIKLFPELSEKLKFKKHEGRAEAILLSYWYEKFGKVNE